MKNSASRSGLFAKGPRCQEKDCREIAFSATDDNRIRCFDHTLKHIEACAAKATVTPKYVFDALAQEIKKAKAMILRRR